MAIALSVLASGANTTGSTSQNTSSVTPTANALIIVSFVAFWPSTVGTISGVTGNGITYQLIGTDNQTSTSTKVTYVYAGMSSSPSTGAITVTSTQSFDLIYSIDQATGVAAGANGSNAINQFVVNHSTSGSTAPTATLAALQSSGSIAYGAIGISAGRTYTLGSGFTQLTQQTTSSNARLLTEYQQNVTTVNATLSSSTSWAVVALELVPLVPLGLAEPFEHQIPSLLSFHYDLGDDNSDFYQAWNLPPWNPAIAGGWDTDAVNQIASPNWTVDKDVDNWTRFIIPPTGKPRAWDTDADNQKPNPPSTPWTDLYDDWTRLIILPIVAWDNDEDKQIPQPPSNSCKNNDIGDDGADLYDGWFIPPWNPGIAGGWDTDADQQHSNEDLRLNDKLVDDWTRLVIIPIQAYPHDGDYQSSREDLRLNDKLTDDWTRLVIIPLRAYDNDADNQKSQPLYTTDRDRDTSNFYSAWFIPPWNPSVGGGWIQMQINKFLALSIVPSI